MKKIIISFLLLISINIFANKNFENLLNIKKNLTNRYKEELGIDFTDFEKNNENEKRIFNETLYLQFISNYDKNIQDVKIYRKNNVVNVILFQDEIIKKELFNMIFDVITLNEKKSKVNLIQVPVIRNKVYGDVIQEKYSER